jgi:hypothetical protein
VRRDQTARRLFTGSYEDLVEHVKLYHDGAVRHLCDGFSMSTGYYAIYPRVAGVFDKTREGVTPEKHPVDFRFRILAPLHDLTDHIEVYVEGLADAEAFIEAFLDVKTGLVNQRATKGGQFILSGNKIKVAGTSARTGFFFTAPGSPAVEIKATEAFAVNDPQRIIGIIPELLPNKQWTREARTRYSNGTTLLKDVRAIASPFTVTQE